LSDAQPGRPPRSGESPNAIECTSYDNVAHEYYDERAHPTCYNFNRLSRQFIERQFPEPWNGQATVEVGAGASSVAALLHARGYSLVGLLITDASAAMLRYSERWIDLGASMLVCDASRIGATNEAYSLLIASLGDPYNTPSFWAEAHRVVKPGGRVLFTTPSYEWSARFRGVDSDAARLAEFLLTSGERLSLPSIVAPLSAQIKMMEDAGFQVTGFESLGTEALHPAEPRSPKLDVFGEDPSSLIWGFALARRSTALPREF
jgi:ubiquinone/menaquinone biosynthesis C-methylase UbiE